MEISEITSETSGVYLITNTKNNKIYVGSGVSIRRRWSKHKTMLRHNTHHNSRIQRDWNTYGECAFVIKILELVENKSLLQTTEQKWMDKLGCTNDAIGYNVIKRAFSGTQPPRMCLNCKKQLVPMRKGRCGACNEYLRRTKKERPVADGYYRVEQVINSNLFCRYCNVSFKEIRHKAKGFCTKCYEKQPSVKEKNRLRRNTLS